MCVCVDSRGCVCVYVHVRTLVPVYVETCTGISVIIQSASNLSLMEKMISHQFETHFSCVGEANNLNTRLQGTDKQKILCNRPKFFGTWSSPVNRAVKTKYRHPGVTKYFSMPARSRLAKQLNCREQNLSLL